MSDTVHRSAATTPADAPPTLRSACAEAMLAGALVYVFVAATVFRVRHPWMTETELLAHTLDAMTWSTIEGRR